MKLFFVVVLSLVLMGCVATYRDFPADALERKPEPGTCSVMYYHVKRFDMLDAGGYSALQNIFKHAGMCAKTVPVDTVPEKGLFVEVETEWKPITLPALVFGYVSVSTLTILPAWSTKEGYFVKYHVYRDGEKRDTYTYEITRKAGLWLGLLPFAWVNLMTYSEEQAFEATAHQFIQDARPNLLSAGL